ncbi:MAG: threonine aldolase family protein [Phycisphaerales bacterium]
MNPTSGHSSAEVIDLRSDTVTRPTPAMRRAMAEAEVGDDVLGDDPTVIALQEKVAALLGKEAALFVPSGTMANQIAIRAQTEPGDEVIAHEDSHILHYETGAPAALSGVMTREARGERGLFEVGEVERLFRPESPITPRSRLLVIENTQNRGGGAVWPLEQLARVAAKGRALGLRVHLDGARIWNASAATGVQPAEYARHFDTVACCFSKGLGAPVGSMIAGDAPTITRARRFRKMFGGAMRQSGVLAAAALHALEHHRARLVEDHEHARMLASAVSATPGLKMAFPAETNIVIFDVEPRLGTAAGVCERFKAAGVWCLAFGPQRVRMVTHMDVSRGMIERACGVVRGLGSQATQGTPKITRCLFEGRFLSIEDALAMRGDGPGTAFGFLCPECRTPVRPHRAGGLASAHFEHLDRQPRCSLSHIA